MNSFIHSFSLVAEGLLCNLMVFKVYVACCPPLLLNSSISLPLHKHECMLLRACTHNRCSSMSEQRKQITLIVEIKK